MARLGLSLLGPFQLTWDGKPLQTPLWAKTQALLAAHDREMTEQVYERVVRGKTAALTAASLVSGAMLGGAMGHLFSYWFPSIGNNTGAFALVGMAALFSATARAPLTAMLIVFEMSNDYFMILPLMVAASAAVKFKTNMSLAIPIAGVLKEFIRR